MKEISLKAPGRAVNLPTVKVGANVRRVLNSLALPTAVLSCAAVLVFAVSDMEVAAAIAGSVCLVTSMASMEKGGEA